MKLNATCLYIIYYNTFNIKRNKCISGVGENIGAHKNVVITSIHWIQYYILEMQTKAQKRDATWDATWSAFR